ncbi:hypothetical protein BST97_06505 [Nonlabens spongiae]|uniref:Uncharacterized protein YyaB-like PH domain-containing protein n=1 Tax=Nonlabens spongiae TaxID=331648 RepID=A0A1W6MJ89_9FLAO|nr:PH domain-containing protein [Nonlabens spongiae]ARN77675.1 hypothetical protein BST97_06505 [Nonlabens spongiae]
MKFRSRKDALLYVLFLVIGVLAVLIFINFWNAPSLNREMLVPAFALLLVLGLLLWIAMGTSYEITENEMKYRSGPIKGAIAISDIHEVVVGKTMWVGLKPATARNGIIVRYEKFSEIYISPDNNQRFVDKLLKRNKAIVVTRHKE